MRVLVCGGRNFSDKAGMFDALDAAHKERTFTVLMHGGAGGADVMSDQWAEGRGVDRMVFPANWAWYGRSGGPRRNKRMLLEGKPDIILAFPGGAGTENMVKIATAAGVPVVQMLQVNLSP